MRPCTEKDKTYTDRILESLLKQRKAPLSESGSRKVLEELTEHMSEAVIFFASAYPRANAKNLEKVHPVDWEKTNIIIGSDNERYLPVFSSYEKFMAFREETNAGEQVYVLNKTDLLAYLDLNKATAAAVLNPMNDDLLLYRINLQNLIQVERQRH